MENYGISKKTLLGIQHTFTMFGATVLVPIITEFDINVALFMAGAGTLLFHFLTKMKIPAYLGSSFAFITPIVTVTTLYKGDMAYASGGLVIAGLIYVLMSLLIGIFGIDKVLKFFPPIVTGPIIILIGLGLASTAIDMASSNYLLAFISFALVAGFSVYAKGFFKVIPVLTGLILSYIAAILMGAVDFTEFTKASLLGIPSFTYAKFSTDAIFIIAPVALVTMVEHIGDIAAISATVGKNFMKDPGLVRTLIGDGLATSLSGFFGGPANTTYSENTGVLALTKVYDPLVVRIAACFSILLGLSPKLGALISTIPTAVIGGISIVLFGMISAVGTRTLVENKIDFTSSRNLIIAATILVLGIGGASIPIHIGSVSFVIQGISLAAFVGILLNIILIEPKNE